MDSVATARLRGLDAQSRTEVREAAQRLLAHGLGALSAELLAAELGASPAAAAAQSGAPAENVWRNVRYGDPDDRRLQVYEELGERKEAVGSVPFGERLVVADEAKFGDELWLRLADGPFTGKWVLGRRDSPLGLAVNCVRMSDWVRRKGAIPPVAFAGQGFPKVGMCTKGYAGSSEICLVSAASDSLWREVHVETLFRDIAAATVREEHWAGETNFGERIVHFATNCAQYGQLRTRRPKRLVVIVRHTPRWRNYQHGLCRGPKIALVRDDVDPMQFKECTWLHSGAQGLELDWGNVEFLTAFEFLRTYCAWTCSDCKRAANEKLFSAVEAFHHLSCDECRSQLESAYWCWDEAFQGSAFEEGLREVACQLLRELAEARTPARPAVELVSLKAGRQPSEEGAREAACDLLRERAASADAAPLPAAPPSPTACAWAAHFGAEAWELLRAPAKTAVENLGHQVYVAGGCAESCIAKVDRYDPLRQEWIPAPAASARRSHLAAAALGGLLYVLGGRDGNSFLALVECFDPEHLSWSPVAPLATARAGLAAAAVDGLLYAIGGWNGRAHLPTVERLDPAEGAGAAWRPLSPLPTARGGLAAAGGLGAGLFALGGEGGHAALSDVECLSPAQGCWTAAAPLPTARSGLAAALLGGGLYAVGGFDGERALAAVERLDLADGSWSALDAGLRTPGHGLAACALGGALYVLGGRDGSYSALPTAEKFDPVTGQWRSLAPLPTPRGYLAVGVLGDAHQPTMPCKDCCVQ